MAYEESLRSISLDADSSLARYTGIPGQPGSLEPNYAFQYTFVKITGAHQVGLATAVADKIVGVLQNKPQVNGMAATVAIRGASNLISGAAITAGDYLTTDAVGRAIPTVTKADALAVAITSAAAAGQLVTGLLRIN